MMNRRSLVLASGILVLAGVAIAQHQGVQAVIGNVFLQDQTPGTEQVGHAAIKGTFRAGQVNVVQATGTTIPIIGNNLATGAGASVGGSFSAAQQSGVALRGTATATTGANVGIRGESRSTEGTGVLGQAKGTNAFGVWARNLAPLGPALVAENTAGGFAARFLGNTETIGAAAVKGVFVTRNSDGLNIFEVRPFGTPETQLNLLFPGGSAAARMDVDAQESGLSLISKNLVQVRLLADFNGVGRVTADVKNFVQPDPDDERRDIVYACVEGPEAAAYIRGAGRLMNGTARVALPRHFQNVSVAEGMTVQLTPRSADSEGLAVVSQSLTGFEVRELRHGRGTYEFNWEVKAVRRGFADYQVSRPWDESAPSDMDRVAAMEARRANAKKVYGIRYGSSGP